MPIYGLTDRGLAFPCIGKIRKGAKKTKETEPGRDLDHFRVEFDAGEDTTAEIFRKFYGDEPRTINFIFPPHSEMEDIASFWLEAYTAGRMVARSDGKVYTYRIDTNTGEIMTLNGINKTTGKEDIYDPGIPAGYYESKKRNSQVPIFCKPVGRMKLVIPELRRAAWLLASTTSVHDCINLSSQIQAYMTDYGNIANIPFVLKRTPRMISTPSLEDPTKKVRREKWLLSIEVNPSWFGRLLDKRQEMMNHMIQPGGTLGLPSGLNTGGWDELPIQEAETEDNWASEPVNKNMGIQDGEVIEGSAPQGDYSDLEFLANSDSVTAFWHLTNRIGMDRDTAQAIVKECKNDFALAFEKTLKQAP